jgi:hypothetical protein
MYNVRADQSKNRLYITLVGFFTIEETKKCSQDIIEAIKKLKPGYDIINDISQFKPSTPDVAKEIERVQAHFTATGVRRGLRVVGASALTGMQFNRTAKSAGYDASSNNVATLEEAEAILDQL